MLKHTIGVAVLGCAITASSFTLAGEHGKDLVVQRDIGVNAQLEAMNAPFRLEKAELLLDKNSGFEASKLTFYKDVGNRNLSSHYVRGDERRGGFDDIAYITDLVDGAANDGMGGTIDAMTTAALIEEGMDNWDAINCATLPLTNLGAIPVDLGLVQFFTGFGGYPDFVADVTHGGWLPPEFFDAIGGPGGGDGILGVTFTFSWVGGDSNGDGKDDTAFTEIYMNNNFAWEVGNDNGVGFFDIRSTMFHEQGHSLSQGHFGEISLNKRGKLIISPKRGDNLMLAAGGSNSEWEGFHGTDTGGHCSIWGSW